LRRAAHLTAKVANQFETVHSGSFFYVRFTDFGFQDHVTALVTINWFHVQKIGSIFTLNCDAHPEVVNLPGLSGKTGKCNHLISFYKNGLPTGAKMVLTRIDRKKQMRIPFNGANPGTVQSDTSGDWAFRNDIDERLATG
jgi:hypothetical protein